MVTLNRTSGLQEKGNRSRHIWCTESTTINAVIKRGERELENRFSMPYDSIYCAMGKWIFAEVGKRLLGRTMNSCWSNKDSHISFLDIWLVLRGKFLAFQALALPRIPKMLTPTTVTWTSLLQRQFLELTLFRHKQNWDWSSSDAKRSRKKSYIWCSLRDFFLRRTGFNLEQH